ncbi:replication factor C subunit 3-like [Microtus pennsylvanicus]|uniref:replication factor C subunit 3-like n=1 Tax=Microtus pennsylvanicus TaxID=10058 RepID=UPI003F6B200A
MNKVDTLTLQLQTMTQERDELRGILANYTNKDLNNRLNFELEMVNMEHKKVMLDLQKFPMEMREALYKCKELTEETVSDSILHNQLLNERTQLKKKVSMLREENRKLWREQISMQVACEKVKNLYEKTDEKFCELCDELDKKQDILVERRQFLLKLRDLVNKHIEMAEKLQNPFAVSQMSSRETRLDGWRTGGTPAALSLWVDKYRPCYLGRLGYHEEQAAQLSNLVQCGDFPHLLVYGPSGAGKKTRIMCILQELYGVVVKKLRFELNLSHVEAGTVPVQMELLSTKTRTPGSPMIRGQKEEQNGAGRAVSRRAQDTLPHKLKICSVLSSVCKKEGLALPSELAHRLAEKSCRNLRKALLMCEACRVQQYPFTEDHEIPETDWEVHLRETANATVSQQTPQRLLEVRGRLYELLTHCIPPEMIMKGLLSELLHNCDGQLKGEVAQMAAYYEHRLQLGSKAIYHLEAFVAKFMALCKMFMEDGLEGMVF